MSKQPTAAAVLPYIKPHSWATLWLSLGYVYSTRELTFCQQVDTSRALPFTLPLTVTVLKR